MDRMPAGIADTECYGTARETSASVRRHDDGLVAEARSRLRLPDEIFRLKSLEVLYQPEERALWTFIRHEGRPSFTPHLLTEFEQWQDLIREGFARAPEELRFLVLGSRTPGVFCFGGDLALFQALIRAGDRAGLIGYGYRCVEILDRNMQGLGLPLVTVGLAQGAALGGGFEALLSFDHLIAEESATFGLPETMFGLFPGMGAHALLTRKLGSAMADRLILSSRTYTAREMYELGIVHEVVGRGEGIAATRAFIARSGRRHAGLYGAKRALRESNPVSLGELKRIVEHWAESALSLREQDLKLMQRLAAAQERKGGCAVTDEAPTEHRQARA